MLFVCEGSSQTSFFWFLTNAFIREINPRTMSSTGQYFDIAGVMPKNEPKAKNRMALMTSNERPPKNRSLKSRSIKPLSRMPTPTKPGMSAQMYDQVPQAL